VSGNTKIAARFSSATGSYSFGITGADLRSASGLTNLTGMGKAVLDVELSIAGANLDLSDLNAQLETPFTTVGGKSSKGKFSFKKHRTLSGVYNWNKTTATQLKDGKFAVAGKGVIESSAGEQLIPTGTIQITIGGEVLTPSTSGVTFGLDGVKRVFQLKATELSATGMPAAGGGAVTVYRLPIALAIPTVDGTNHFDTTIELKRPTDLSLKWSR
jgi:hypothetical protein